MRVVQPDLSVEIGYGMVCSQFDSMATIAVLPGYVQLLAAAWWFISTPFASATGKECPNYCNQLGVCNDGVCACNNFSSNRWHTGPDCSRKNVPEHTAWYDGAVGNDDAHHDARCSNMGIYDAVIGTCYCRPGWTGEACQRVLCPGTGGSSDAPNTTVCSGRGRCLSMAQMGSTTDGISLLSTFTYNLWDAEMIYGCVCSEGFTGYDCSQRECPKGDDPLTTGQVDEVQIIECTCAATCSGSFRLSFMGRLTAEIGHDAPAAIVKLELEKLKHVRGVTVAMFGSSAGTVCDNDGVSTTVTFTHNPGALSPMSASSALMTTGSAATVSVLTSGSSGVHGGVSVTGTRENAECSGRGGCVLGEGWCTCNEGFSSSDGAGGAGSTGDCSYQSGALTKCHGDLSTTAAIDECSGRGTCSGAPNYQCTCESGYAGASCEVKSCPSGTSWFDEPSATDTAHTSVVACSNRGLCSKVAGTCECYEGFDGDACEKLACGGGGVCLARGSCHSMAEMAALAEDNGDLRGVTYTTPWDAHKVHGCRCTPMHGIGPFSVVTDYASYVFNRTCTLTPTSPFRR
jgi:hypothetical protein